MAKIISVKYIGKHECYDLEVDHPDHQFYLSSGLLTSNSHSIAYSINGFHTAYYKRHFPAAFMCALLKSESDGNGADRDSNIRLYKREARRLKLKILPPDINQSELSYSVVSPDTIITGLTSIKGLGSSSATNILKARSIGLFKSFADFLYRTESSKVKKDSIQALAKAGAFDSIGITRRAAFTYYQDIRQKANKHGAKLIESGINKDHCLDEFVFSKEDLNVEWTKKEILENENEVLGEFISGGVKDIYGDFFTSQGTTFDRVKNMPDKAQVRIEAILTNITEAKLKSGKSKGKIYARCSMADVNGDTINLTIWNDSYLRNKDRLIVGRPFKALCSVNDWNNVKGLVLIELSG